MLLPSWRAPAGSHSSSSHPVILPLWTAGTRVPGHPVPLPEPPATALGWRTPAGEQIHSTGNTPTHQVGHTEERTMPHPHTHIHTPHGHTFTSSCTSHTQEHTMPHTTHSHTNTTPHTHVFLHITHTGAHSATHHTLTYTHTTPHTHIWLRITHTREHTMPHTTHSHTHTHPPHGHTPTTLIHMGLHISLTHTHTHMCLSAPGGRCVTPTP